MDDWWGRLYGEPGSGPDATTGIRATREKGHGARAKDHAPERVSTTPEASATPAPHIPPPASRWGSGRTLDPFLQENPAHPELQEEPKKAEPTPEEPPKNEEAPTKEPEEAPAPKEERPPPALEEKAPPQDDEDPEEGKNWGTRLREAKENTRKIVSKGASKVSTATAPARKGAVSAINATAPGNGEPYSFFWSLIGAWVVSPQTLVALADRIVLIFGAPRPLSGEERMEWGWLQGLGPWFGNQVGLHLEDGSVHRLFLLFLVGLLPLVALQFAEKLPDERLSRALTWVGYGVPVFFILSISYIPAMGFHSWSELYVSLLAALSWWGFSVSRTIQAGFFQCVLRIPFAAVIVGIGLNAPGAAF